MIGVIAIGPKVRRSKSGRGDGFLRAIEMPNTTYFGDEVNREAQCNKILRHIKITYRY
jgi:hypothetical protein